MVNINKLNGGNVTITIGSSEPTTPNGKVLYKTSAAGEWLQSDAQISNGIFTGFNEKSSAVAVILPSKDANGNDVTRIGDGTFLDCNELTELTIPSSVTNIGSGAFNGCGGLTSVTIPNSVTNIGNSAFYDCSGLTSVTIPGSVTNIGASAFYGCSGLTGVTIGNGVTSIGNRAFAGCDGLTSVTIGNGIQRVGQYAFDTNGGSVTLTIDKTKAEVEAMGHTDYDQDTNVTYSEWGLSMGATIVCTDEYIYP